MAEIAIVDQIRAGIPVMKTMSAKDAKNAFGMLIDIARAEPVTVEKHGRPVVVVMSVEEYKRLVANGASEPQSAPPTRRKPLHENAR